MATTRKLTDPYNDKRSYVVKDLIWKDHISKIDVAQKWHNQRWGFMNELQPRVNKYDARRSPRALLARTNPSAELKKSPEEDHPPIIVSPSPRPVPIKTSDMIGWRTTDKNCALEKFGSYARGQDSLHRQFKWPIEGFD